MPGLFLPRRWTRQPQGPVEIDWSNPIARGIVAAINSGSGPIELVSRQPMTYGNFGMAATQDGLSFKANKLTAYTDSWLIPVPRKSYAGLSTLLRTRIANLNDGYPGLMNGAAVNSVNGLVNVGLALGNASGSRFDLMSPTLTIHGASWNNYSTVCECAYGGFDWRYFGDGLNVRTIGQTWNKSKNSGYGRMFISTGEIPRTGGTPITTDSVWTNSSSSGLVRIGNVGTTFGAEHYVSEWVLWDRDLDATEFASLMEAPYQVFRPRRAVLYSFPSGGIVIPTLSLPGVQDVTTTGARPKVTLTF